MAVVEFDAVVVAAVVANYVDCAIGFSKQKIIFHLNFPHL
jgi:hypothetical protein